MQNKQLEEDNRRLKHPATVLSLDRGTRVTRVHERLLGEHAASENLPSDNNPEFTSRRSNGRKTESLRCSTFNWVNQYKLDECLKATLVSHLAQRLEHAGGLTARVQLRATAQWTRLPNSGCFGKAWPVEATAETPWKTLRVSHPSAALTMAATYSRGSAATEKLQL
jgi:hypothetical protein